MKLSTANEIVFCEGSAGKPLAVFIHGMGMDVRVWSSPADARVLGGKYSLSILLRKGEGDMRSLFMELAERGFPVLAWSQLRPVGPIMSAVAELQSLLASFKRHTGNGVVLIGHSRGGLIARKYLQQESSPVRGLFTLAAPHQGTTLARWAAVLAPAASVASQALEKYKKNSAKSAFHRILLFFTSTGLKELLPESPFYAGLKDLRHKSILYVSAGGTDPDLFRVGDFPLSEVARLVLPGKSLPEELKKGHGDGMVSAASSVLPFSAEHRDFPVNHVEILFDKRVRELLIKSMLTC
ncbi:MAG: alpha/beta fold hydrolase [Nitrospirae bacterium]|nr:alpha/beta fold hydrolase [Nitrospirota bacterium]